MRPNIAAYEYSPSLFIALINIADVDLLDVSLWKSTMREKNLVKAAFGGLLSVTQRLGCLRLWWLFRVMGFMPIFCF